MNTLRRTDIPLKMPLIKKTAVNSKLMIFSSENAMHVLTRKIRLSEMEYLDTEACKHAVFLVYRNRMSPKQIHHYTPQNQFSSMSAVPFHVKSPMNWQHFVEVI